MLRNHNLFFKDDGQFFSNISQTAKLSKLFFRLCSNCILFCCMEFMKNNKSFMQNFELNLFLLSIIEDGINFKIFGGLNI